MPTFKTRKFDGRSLVKEINLWIGTQYIASQEGVTEPQVSRYGFK